MCSVHFFLCSFTLYCVQLKNSLLLTGVTIHPARNCRLENTKKKSIKWNITFVFGFFFFPFGQTLSLQAKVSLFCEWGNKSLHHKSSLISSNRFPGYSDIGSNKAVFADSALLLKCCIWTWWPTKEPYKHSVWKYWPLIVLKKWGKT